jgi:hypothetical protein
MLARFVAETTLEQVPDEVQRYAKLVIPQSAHDAASASADPATRQMVELLLRRAGSHRSRSRCCYNSARPRRGLSRWRSACALEWEAERANVFRFPEGLPTGPRQS